MSQSYNSNISESINRIKSKFELEAAKGCKHKNTKLGHNGAWPRSRDLLFKILESPIKSDLAEATNVKFCRRIVWR